MFGPVVAVVPVVDWLAVAVVDVEEAGAVVDWERKHGQLKHKLEMKGT